MPHEIVFAPQSIKDLKCIPRDRAGMILSKIENLKHDRGGDVKRLKNFFPKYRLRVGDYRVLFEMDGGLVVVYRILHRRMAYD